MTIRRFEDIEAWQLARQLCVKVDFFCGRGPFAKDFSLRDQIQRASGSAMDNIAEGFDGGSNPEFARFLGYSQRSCREVQSQLYRALDRKHLTEAEFQTAYDFADHTYRKVGAFIKYLKGAGAKGKPNASQRRTTNKEPRNEQS